MESEPEHAPASLPAGNEQTVPALDADTPMLAGIRARRIILLPAFPALSASGYEGKGGMLGIPFADRCGGSAGSERPVFWPAPPCFPLN